jgi:hypothetical protein
VLSPLAAAGSVLLAAATLALALAVVGAAVRVLTRSRMAHLPSAAVTVGLGAAVVAVVVAVSFRLTGRSHTALTVLLVTAFAVVVVATVRDLRGSADRRATVRSWWHQVVNPRDLSALALALLLLAVPLSLGLSFWTGGSNDFHRYAASVQVWQSDEAGYRDFRAVQSGDFEASQVARGLSEKPMSTALLLAASRLTGIAPYAVLTPLLLVAVWVGAAATIHVLVRRFGLDTGPAVAVTVATTLSLAPTLALTNAQLGHALVLCLAAVSVAVAATAAPARSPVPVAVVLGTTLTATLGSNASVVIGAGPLLAATLFWVLRRGGTPTRRTWGVLAGAGIVGAVLIAPFVSWMLVSLGIQTTGEAGVDIPLASPLAFVGLQVSRDAAAPLAQSLVSWAAVAVVLALVVRPSRALVRRHAPFVAVLVAGLGSVLVLALRWGPDTYIVFKWTLTAIAVVMPLVLAAAVARIGQHHPSRRDELRIGLAFLAAVALAISLSTMRGSGAGARLELQGLADDERLAAVEVLNIDLTDYYSNSMAPLLVPSARVVVNRPTYADPEAPVGDIHLVQRDQLGTGAYQLIEVLSDRYALARRDLTVEAATTLEVGADPAARGVLVGSWADPGDGRVWARSALSWIALDPVGELADADLSVTLTGLRLPPGQSPRPLEIGAGDGLLTSVELESGRDASVTLEVPATLVDDDGRLRLSLYMDGPGPRTDLKDLEYSLESITVTPAGQRS